MEYKITESIHKQEIIKDIEKSLKWHEDGGGCTVEIMMIPVGVVRRDNKVSAILYPDNQLIR